MTIDEAIKMYKKIANTDENCPRYCMRPCEDCVQECKQVLEWLEELKELRATSCGFTKEDIELNRTAMCNKAIDDFAEKIKSEYEKYDIDCVFESSTVYSYTNACCIFENYIEEIAEQLKAGVSNERM